MISSDHLDPGVSGKIRASVDTTGKSGRLEKYVTVYSNDAGNPAVTLGLSMEVIQK